MEVGAVRTRCCWVAHAAFGLAVGFGLAQGSLLPAFTPGSPACAHGALLHEGECPELRAPCPPGRPLQARSLPALSSGSASRPGDASLPLPHPV